VSSPAEIAPDQTAVRVALWRALHVEVDAPPHVLVDQVGLQIAAPDERWRERPDMHPEGTRAFRASIVARARFVEDLVAEQLSRGVEQYVILGAGLDAFAQRRPDLMAHLRVFEIDRPGPLAWKQQRLRDLGLAIPAGLRFVPTDFEERAAWRERLVAAGFDRSRPAVVASAGVSMYLTREANAATLHEVAELASATTFVTSFLVPLEHAEPSVRPGLERAAQGARASGTPFVSYFMPAEIAELALSQGFARAEHVSAAALTARYFSGRADGLAPPLNAEELLVASSL
jgi:methyltransferase (TIGR00027 family)